MPTPLTTPAAPPTQQPFTYREARDLFSNLQSQGLFQNQDLAGFSNLINDATGSQVFGASDSQLGNWVKGFAAAKDEKVREMFPGAVETAGQWGQDIFKYFGADEESGRQLGESMPNMAADFAPAILGPVVGALAGPAGPVISKAGTVATSLLSAATAYEQTDSLLHAGIALLGFPIAGGAQKLAQPVIGAALRKLGLKGGETVSKVLTTEMAATPEGRALINAGARVGEELTQKVAKSIGDRVGYYVGGQTAVNAVFEGANFAADAYNKGLGQAYQEHATKEHFMSLLVSNLPFAALDLPHLVKPTPLTPLMRAHVETSDQINAGSLIEEKVVEPNGKKEKKKNREPDSPEDVAINEAVEKFKAKSVEAPVEIQVTKGETPPPLDPNVPPPLNEIPPPLDFPPAEDLATPPPLDPELPAQEPSSQVGVKTAEEVQSAKGKMEELLSAGDRVENEVELDAVAEAVAEEKSVVEAGDGAVSARGESRLESGVVEDTGDLVEALAEEKVAAKKASGEKKLGRTSSKELGDMLVKFMRDGMSVEEGVEELRRVVGTGTLRNQDRNEAALKKMLQDREARNGGFRDENHRKLVQALNDNAGPLIEWAKEEVALGSKGEMFTAHKVLKEVLERPEVYLAPDEMAGPEFQGRIWRAVGQWKKAVESGKIKGKNGKVIKDGEGMAVKLEEMIADELSKRRGSAKGAERNYVDTAKSGIKTVEEARALREKLKAKLGKDSPYFYSVEKVGEGSYSVKRRQRVVKQKLSLEEREVLDSIRDEEELQQQGLRDVLADEGFSELEKERAQAAFKEALLKAENESYTRLNLDVREAVTMADDPKLSVDWIEFDRLIHFDQGEWKGDIPWLVATKKSMVLDPERYPGLSQVFGRQKVIARDLVAFLELRAKVITGEVLPGDFAAFKKVEGGSPTIDALIGGLVAKPDFKTLVVDVAMEHGLHPEVAKRLGERAEILEGLWGGGEETVYASMKGEGLLGAASTKGGVKALFLAADEMGRELGDPLKLMLVSGHEAAHNYEWSMRKGKGSREELEAFGRYQEFSEVGAAEDKAFALEVFADAFVPKELRGHEAVRELVSVEKNADPAEWRANMLSLWSMSKLDLADVRLAHGLQEPSVRGYFQGLVAFAGRMYRSVKAALGLTRGAKEVKKLKVYVDQIEGYRKAARDAEATLAEASKMQRAGRYDTKEMAEIIKGELDGLKGYVGKSVTITKPVDRVLDWYDQRFNTIDQYAEALPVLKGLTKVAHAKAAQAAAVTKKLNSVMTGTLQSNGQPSYDAVGKAILKIRENPAARLVLNAWALAQQRNGAKLIEYKDLVVEQPKIWTELNKLPAETHQSIKDAHERVGLMVKEAHKEIFACWDRSVVNSFRNIFAAKSKDNWAIAESQSRALLEAVKNQDFPAAFVAMEQVEGWKGDQDKQLLTIEKAKNALDTVEKNKIAFSKKPGYWSLAKAGKWYMHWTENQGGKVVTDGLGFDSEKDARAFAKKYLQHATNVDIRLAGNSKEFRLDDDMFGVMEASHKQFEEIVDSMGLDEDQAKLLKIHGNPVSDIMAHLNAKVPGLVGTGRKPNATSTNHMDMLETQFHFMHETGNAIAKTDFSSNMVYEKLNPALDPFPEKVRMFESVLDNFLHPDTATGRNFNTMNSIMFVASNISSWFVELTQGLSTFLPELTNHGVGIVKGHKMLVDAHKKTLGFTLRSIRDRVDNNKNWNDPELEVLMDEASRDNLISMASSVDGAQMDEGLKAGIDAASLRTKGKIESTAKYFGNQLAHLGMFSLRQYRKVTEHNARTSLVMGWELAKTKGLKGQEARDFAKDFSRVVTYSGGKLNRPILPFSGKGAWRTFGQIAMSLQTYTMNNIAQWVRYARTAYSGTLEGNQMSKVERAQARKALAQMTLTQFGMAGLLGMPFVQSAMILLGNAINENFEEDVREGIFDFGKLLSDDDEFGGALQEIVSTGAANYILEKAGVPIDFSSRQAIGGALGFNNMDGFSGDKLLGPTASLFTSAMAGTRALVSGEPALAAQEFAPTGLKKAINLARNDFKITDKSGKRVVEDATLADKILYAIGFQNSKLSKNFSVDRIRKDNGALESKDTSIAVKRLAQIYKEDPARMMSEFQKTLKEHPSREANAMGRAVADRLVDTTFPQDYRRDGTRGTASSDAKLLAMFGVQPSAPTELDRLRFKAQVLGSMGLDSRLTPSEVQAARMLDQMMRQNRNLTRQGAKMILESQRPHRRPASTPIATPQLTFNF